MTAYREIELRCDGVPGDRFGCSEQIFAGTVAEARRIAREKGWQVNVNQDRRKDYCPGHKS